MKTLREKLTREFLEQEDAMHGDGQVKLEDRVDIAIDALRQWLADEGLVVVPRDPSDEMAETGWSVRGTQFEPTPDAQEIYRVMIAAAPDALRAEGE